MTNPHSTAHRFHPFAAVTMTLVTLGLAISSRAAEESFAGMVGVGTWSTQAEFKDLRVTKEGRTLFASNFANGLQGWKTHHGQWQVVDGALRQTGNEEDARALVGDPAWSDYTLTLKARKLGGREGFLILFGMPSPDAEFKSWWNVGGWSNTAHGLQAPGIWEQRIPGTIESHRWYDIKLEVVGATVRAYLDNRLVQTATKPTAATAQRRMGHALVPDLTADPSVAEFDGTFYLYATPAGMGPGLATPGLPVALRSTDFLNRNFSRSIFPPNFDAKYWAPSAPVFKDGRYYLFPTLDNRITAVVADSPEGPFRTLDGKDLTKTSGWKPFPIAVGHPIDAEVFRDDDGSYYMTWSQRFIAKLKSDFTGFEGEPLPIKTKRDGYSEGPCLIKRNGIYYYLYTLGGSEAYQYAYMTSRGSPLGPWEAPEQDIIATTDLQQGIFGPGHGCFFNPKGSSQWYFAYLEYGRSGTNRQVMADKMDFNPDGTIRPIKLTLQGPGALRRDPNYATPNLALGKSTSASTTMPDSRIPPIADPRLNRIEGFGPANALDGSNGSRWMADPSDTAAWFRIDLGEARDIKRTELYFVKPTTGHAYRLECSLDGESWRPYGGHDDPKVQSPHTDVHPARARYLKLSILNGTPGLWEFRVY